ALASQSGAHDGDFVYDYVGPGTTENGETYDFGLNYRQCGFCKLLGANGDDQLLPAICAMDEKVYALRGIELFRTTTIAAGDSHCNFRFRAATEKSDG
nr:L-2-amino-thiazoline-4-carboxylic acid hydrolase [Pseudomonadota bacterium]